MATNTTRLGLRKPAGVDLVSVSTDVSASMDTIDTAIDRICTSSTRPSSPFLGMRCYETDTGRFIVCGQSTPSVLWGYYNSIAGTKALRPVVAGTQGIFAGTNYYETDTHNNLVHTGAAWEHSSVPRVAALADIPAPYDGMLVVLSTDNCLYRRKSSTSSWRVVRPLWDGMMKWRNPNRNGDGHSGGSNTDLPNGDSTLAFPTADSANATFITPSGTNNLLFTLLYEGWYAITANSRVTTANANHELQVCQGAQPIAGSGAKWRAPASAAGKNGNANLKRYFSANDTVFINFFNNAGATVPLDTAGECNWVSFEYIGQQT